MPSQTVDSRERSRRVVERFWAHVGLVGLSCPFCRGRLDLVYATELTVRLRCADHAHHELSVAIGVLQAELIALARLGQVAP
jgi:hypothetical protein